MKNIPLYYFLLSSLLSISQEITVIDNKGTIKTIDNSKWSLSGLNIYNKNTGNVGIGTNNPQSLLHTFGTLRFENLGTNTTNNTILTTDASGNVTIRTFSNFIENNTITSLNGLTNSVQTFQIGTTGTDFNINSTATSHTFNIPTASATQRGLLSSTNWNTFNTKIGTVTATTPAAATTSGTTVSINNTTANWNANQLQGRNIATMAPTNGQVLKYDGTQWLPSTEAAATNWLLTGNSNANASSFLGTTNDIKISIRSNNTSMFEVGRRQTLGLYDSSSTGIFPYNQQNASVTHIRGTGGVSALQFESSAALFYKPTLFTDANGNFMMRGSSAGTDFFEIGSSGAANDGKLIFSIADDGNEPMIFRKYNYTTQSYIEMLRMQGTGLNSNVRVGIKTNGAVANSTLQVAGSFSLPIIKTTASLALNESHYTVIITGNHTITLPAASTCIGRIYVLKNISGGNRTVSRYVNRSGNNSTALANNQITILQSDGTNWQSISER